MFVMNSLMFLWSPACSVMSREGQIRVGLVLVLPRRRDAGEGGVGSLLHL